MVGSLVVILVVDLIAAAPVEAAHDPPAPIHVNRPLTLPPALQWMESKAGRIEISNTGGSVKSREDPPDLRHVVWIHSSSMTRLEEPLEPSVPESDDHQLTVTRNGSSVNNVS